MGNRTFVPVIAQSLRALHSLGVVAVIMLGLMGLGD